MKLVRRDMKTPAIGCSWTWEVQRAPKRLPGIRLPSTGVMDTASAQTVAETQELCSSFCYREEHSRNGAPQWRILICAPPGSRKPPETTPEDEEAKLERE